MVKKQQPREVPFEDACVVIRPEVLYVRGDRLDVDPESVISEVALAQYGPSETTNALAMSDIEMVIFTLPEGFAAIVENPWGDDSAAEEAFERWVEQKESAGDEWNEDEFVFDDSSVIEGPPLASGIYLIGLTAISDLLPRLGVTESSIPTEFSPTEARGNTATSPVPLGDSSSNSRLVADLLSACSWDEIGRSLKLL